MSGDLDDLRAKLDSIMGQLRESVDISLDIRKNEPQCTREVNSAWEDFLGQFFRHVKKKGKETSQNLLSGISITKILRN